MSAFHWEARRRQAALERRRAALLRATGSSRVDTTQGTDNGVTQALPPGEQKAAPGWKEELRVDPSPAQPCHCPCYHASNPSAKLPNRFSAVQYMQQW